MFVPPAMSYVDFEVVNEPRNRYQLSDGTILYSRTIVIQIVKHGQYDVYGKPLYGIVANNLNSFRAPQELRRPPTLPPPTIEEIRDSIVDDVNAEPMSEEWSSYKCMDGTIIKVKGILTSIKRTSVYDVLGEPVYIVNVQNVIKDDVPKSLWKKIMK